MTTNKENKEKLLKVLFNLPVDTIDTEIVKWAATHLPNDSKSIISNYDHNKGDVMEALGISRSEAESMDNMVHSHILNTDFKKRSEIVEFILSSGNDKLIAYYVAKAILYDDGLIQDDNPLQQLIKRITGS